MLVALSVLVVGAVGLAVTLGIETYKEYKEEKKNESNTR